MSMNTRNLIEAKYAGVFVVIFILFACEFGVCQKKPQLVSLSHLMTFPKNFDHTVIRVQGILVIENQPRHAPLVILYKEPGDARSHLTKNGVLVIPSPEMIHSQGRINRRRVRLIGTFHAVPGPGNSYGLVIKDIRKCELAQ